MPKKSTYDPRGESITKDSEKKFISEYSKRTLPLKTQTGPHH